MTSSAVTLCFFLRDLNARLSVDRFFSDSMQTPFLCNWSSFSLQQLRSCGSHREQTILPLVTSLRLCAWHSSRARVCMRASMCAHADARLSPAEVVSYVGVEVEGECRGVCVLGGGFYKSGQITEAQRPATPLQQPELPLLYVT